jgi:IS5 family transposase
LRNLDELNRVAADKGPDWDEIKYKLRSVGIRPVIKLREFYALNPAQNARIENDPYHRRKIVEVIIFALRKGFGSKLRARTWFSQFAKVASKPL